MTNQKFEEKIKGNFYCTASTGRDFYVPRAGCLCSMEIEKTKSRLLYAYILKDKCLFYFVYHGVSFPFALFPYRLRLGHTEAISGTTIAEDWM